MRCRLRNAAARFFTSRASRFDRPETSGGTKSFTLIQARGFFVLVVVAFDETSSEGERFKEEDEVEDELGDWRRKLMSDSGEERRVSDEVGVVGVGRGGEQRCC